MTKYILKTGEAANVGWNVSNVIYSTEEEAMKAYHNEVESYIKQTVSDNDMTADEEAEYREEIEEDYTDVSLNAYRDTSDPDYAWFVELYTADEK